MNQPLRLGCLALLNLGCLSQTLIMARSSSGAVDRDVDFTPLPGADGHFISLPAYPISNCTDTLVYERLVQDFDKMVLALGRLPVTTVSTALQQSKQENNRAPLDFLTQLVGTEVGARLQTAGLDEKARRQLADALVRTIHPADLSAFESSDRAAQQGAWNSVVSLLATQETGNRSQSGDESKKTRAAAATRVNELVAANANDLNSLLVAGGKDKFKAADMAALLGGAAATKDGTKLAEAAADFVSYADDYGPAACSSAQRHRGFLGFRDDPQMKTPGVSWLDRSSCVQLDALGAIARLAGIPTWPRCQDSDIPGRWPKPIQSFLHFSDVQIREPSAKLGNPKLSHDLKQLVNTFEQDYVQEQYAIFVYDALVRTANAEIEAAKADLVRPPPNIMIHTGDSADTGLQSEFDTFVTTTDKLHRRWFQVIGNHDVVAFGNLRLAGKKTPHLLEDVRCQGANWSDVACSCTSIGTLIREKEIRGPNNRGEISGSLPNGQMPLVPLLLQRVCLLHAVQADWFVMDPDKNQSDDPTKSFVQSQCRGWHPRPRDPSASSDDADGQALSSCLNPPPSKEAAPAAVIAHGSPSAASAAVPAAPPPRSTRDARCATLADSKSKFHGFDLLPDFRDRLNDVPAKSSANAAIGYYCFEVEAIHGGDPASTPTPRLWAIVLNTNTHEGSYGYLADEQLDWLEHLLQNPKGQIASSDLVMLFAHHPVWAIYDQKQRMRLTDLVTKSRNVIGYFAGHTHQAGLRVIRPLSGSPGTAKWEIVAPSVIDYPQAVRQVTVKSTGELGYIEVLTFTSHGTGPSVEKIRAAEQGAIRDRCANSPDRCIEGHALLPGREIEFPRLFFRMPSEPPGG